GVTGVSHKMMSESEQKDYQSLCAYHDTRSKINQGSKVVLGESYSINNSKGPFDVIRRPARKRHFICVDQYENRFKISYKHIDWIETAKKNDVSLV
ncbi:MAG: hypothetical protein ACTSWQ_03950, partial [Candidatus Thorarchaeota archaeon]